MKFDPVHDSQSIFRSLLSAHAFPGTLRDISTETERIDPGIGVDPRLAALALALIDGEVSFSWLGDGAAAETVAKLCSSEPRSAREADFVFAASGIASLLEALRAAKEGDLVDPQRGATIIALADRLVAGSELVAGGELEARGPGIADSARFAVEFKDASPDEWIAERARRNVEFPLGVDLIFVDRDGGLMAFPRSTKLARA
jgi:alpha-D-ribose 1-methylphosphonate 5-triphosphate synthase subunit PhnH